MIKKKRSTIHQKSKKQDETSIQESKELEASKEALIEYLLRQHVLTLETLNLDKKTAHDLYEQAYQLYSAGQFVKAKSLFSMLLLYKPSDPQFLYGYATCCFMLKEYESAADCYINCGQLDLANPLPYFYAADCYMQQQDLISTCVALEMAVKRSGDIPEYTEIKQRAQLTLDALEIPQELEKAMHVQDKGSPKN